MLKSMDFFSGIGGLPYALRSVATPILYCDKMEACRLILNSNFNKGRLPRGPILHDIRVFNDGSVYKWTNDGLILRSKDHFEIKAREVDLVTASIPCIGWSAAGKGEGLNQPQSGLAESVVKLIGNVYPKYFFFENVPGIMQDFESLICGLSSRSYKIYWLTTAANTTVGAPHTRRRWFCLGVAKNAPPPPCIETDYFDWSFERYPVVTNNLSVKEAHVRRAVLGNSIVIPHAVYAWNALVNAANTYDISLLEAEGKHYDIGKPARRPDDADRIAAFASDELSEIDSPTGPSAKGNPAFAKRCKTPYGAVLCYSKSEPLIHSRSTYKLNSSHGAYFVPLRINSLPMGVNKAPWTRKLILNNDFYPSSLKTNVKGHLPLITSDITKNVWATPLFTAHKTSRVLTKRLANDFNSQPYFEKQTNPRVGEINPNYVEWMFGYPEDWTKLDLVDWSALRKDQLQFTKHDST